MKNLETLIQELCPDGVEFVKFKECCEYVRGITYNKSKEVFDENERAWNVLRANNITLSNNYLNFDDVKRVSIGVKVKDSQLLKCGDILICAGSGSKDHIGKVAYIDKDMDCTFGGFMAVIRSSIINTRFLFHILTGSSFKKYLSLALNSSTINNLNSSVMGNFEIPLPPLEVQTEIVRILDKFTSLEAELEAELDCRKRQYEYYRDKLLSFENAGGQEVEWKKMSEVIYSINTGLNPRRFFRLNTPDATNYYVTIREMKNGNIIFSDDTDKINNEAMKLCNNRSNLEKGDLIFSGTGTIGQIVVLKETPTNWNIKEGLYALKPIKEVIDSKFLAYILNESSIRKAYTKKALGGTVKSVPMKVLTSIKLPIPSLREQQRIVSILDRFESLTTSLQSGLPAEIAARRQQYEYYRDKLLTFKRKTA